MNHHINLIHFNLIRLERVPSVLRIAEKERVRIKIWILERVNQDPALHQMIKKCSEIRRQLMQRTENGSEITKFKPKLVIDCLTPVLKIPDMSEAVLVKLCGAWIAVCLTLFIPILLHFMICPNSLFPYRSQFVLQVPNDEVASKVVKQLRTGAITPDGRRHQLGSLQSSSHPSHSNSNNMRGPSPIELLRSKISEAESIEELRVLRDSRKGVVQELESINTEISETGGKLIVRRNLI